MIIISYITLCLLFVVFLYAISVKVEGKIVNVMVPYLIITVPTLYIFEGIFVYLSGIQEYNSEYLFFYTCYVLYIASFVLSYLYSQRKEVDSVTKISNDPRYVFSSILFTLLAFFFYLPVLIEFREYILIPRRIYELTRTGYGIYFYPSLMFSLVASICAFFTHKKSKLFCVAIVLINCVLIFLHGNKGPIFSIFIAFILYLSYIENKRIRFMFLVKSFAVIAFIVTAFFAYTFTDGNPIENMANYSDYTRNAVLVASSNFDFMYGKLLMESEVYSRIPRAIWPSKPDDFGALHLAKVFFPDAFYRNEGAPAFGYGELYADFGLFTPVWLIVSGVFKGILAKYFSNKTQENKSAHYFIMFLFCIGISIIPVSMGWLFPEHLMVAFMVYIASSFVFFNRKKFVFLKNSA
ncbi:O-antigen polymerase [Salmonella enterica]|uniref:O-antigen polymerase n=6 Tax=Salmonella enterica TaxID=28901 RepID=A0A5I1C9J5_SALET|nr:MULTISPECIES: O-antigen polymerase [Salmonella]EBB5077639.1 O-antigen polymerase [Salmonella enterica subsp. enterica serovar Typhimurium]EDB5600979.1 O-antigen polymerase [Salmonella enterica subsp. enterica serovar Kentucky]EHE6770020.1 O-antigen polymerase [Salmonella enterica subsp. enterica serovar Agona]HAZ2895699.1 O-antigen polymerase [Salmonella enterica subsp. enterica serovar Newport]EAB6290101.1 O-antigen polymerase [Salmonella enterica subsp. enterica serovar Bredeney]